MYFSLFFVCRDASGKFPEFPGVEEGGSASIFTRKTPEHVISCVFFISFRNISLLLCQLSLYLPMFLCRQVSAELAVWEEEREKKKKGGGPEKKKEKAGKRKKKKKKKETEVQQLN